MKKQEKDEIRTSLIQKVEKHENSRRRGRMAEQVRKSAFYRQAKQLFVSPHPVLDQIRINSLADGKILIMPGPGLREGFYLLRPYSIPFKDLPVAVTYKGLAKYGEILDPGDISREKIDLMITEAMAVDRSGLRLGCGDGYFDLSCAILYALHALSEEVIILAVLKDEKLRDADLPRDPWDVEVDGVFFGNEVKFFEKKRAAFPDIHWGSLPPRRIKKIRPLRHLYQQRQKEPHT